VSPIVLCGSVCCLLFERGVLFCVLRLIVVPLPRTKPHLLFSKNRIVVILMEIVQTGIRRRFARFVRATSWSPRAQSGNTLELPRHFAVVVI
jgi:hypothetical protein